MPFSQPITGHTDLYRVCRAASLADGENNLREAVREANNALQALAKYAPSLSDSAARSDDSHSSVYSSHSAYNKRTLWSKDPVTDISEAFPEYDGSMLRFMLGCIRTIHTSQRSRLSSVLSEQEPYNYVVSAIYAKLLSGKGQKMLENHDASRLAGYHRSTVASCGDALERARQDPSAYNIESAVDVFCQGIVNIVASYNGSKPITEVHICVTRLCEFVMSAPNESSLDYACLVDIHWQRLHEALGRTWWIKMCNTGMLSFMLPKFLDRLEHSMRQRAMEYWNGVVKPYVYDDTIRAKMIPQMRAIVDMHMSDHRHATTTMPSWTKWVGRPDELEAALAQGAASQQSVAVVAAHVLDTPADLHWIAASGLLTIHWEPFIHHLIGNHKLSVSNRSVNIFFGDADNGAETDEEDEPDDAGVFVQTRGTAAARRTSGSRADDSSYVEYDTAPARPRQRPRSDDSTMSRNIERFIDTAAKSEERLEAKLGKVLEVMEEKVGRVRDTVAADLAKLTATQSETAAKLSSQIQQREDRARDQSAQWYRTIELQLQNIANNATDLRKADGIRQASSSIGAAARELVADVEEIVDPRTHSEVFAAMRERRPMKVDAEGYKLSHVKPNMLAHMCPDMQSIYADRDKVTSESQYEALAERTCVNCPADAINMPHREKHCPFCWRSGARGNEQVPPAAVQKAQQRVRDNAARLRRAQPAMLVVDFSAMDDEADDGHEAPG